MLRSILVFVLGSLPLLAYAGDPLEDAAMEQAVRQESQAQQVGEFLKGSGKKTDFQVLLEAGQCYWFSAASQGLGKLQMFLWQPNAIFIAPPIAQTKTNGQGTLAICAKESGIHKFQVKTDGTGPYVVGIFAKAAPKQPEPPKGPELGDICDKTASAAAKDATRQGDFFEGKGASIGADKTDYTIQMEKGVCYWLIACGEPDKVKTMSLFLWGPDNKRITETKSDTSTPMVGHCAKDTGMFKLQAKMTGGSGAYKVGVYSKAAK